MPSVLGYSVRGAAADTIVIDIYNVVGGEWFFGGVQAEDVRWVLKNNPNAKTIEVHINSEGGDCFQGFAIYHLLKEHSARVIVFIDSLAASIASVIAMAADEIRIAPNAWIMIHNASGIAHGGPEDMRRWADVVERTTGQMADVYAARTKVSREELLSMMAAETWMTAQEAKAKGFADVVLPLKTASAQASAALAQVSLDSYSNVPAGVRELVEQARAARKPQDDVTARAPSASTTTETNGDTMNKIVILAALSLPQTATDEQLEAAVVAQGNHLKAVEALTGKTGEEAMGVLRAWKQAHAELETANTELSKLKAAALERDLSAAIEKAKAEHRHTPAREEELRKLLEAKDLSNAGAIAMVGAWGVVKALAAGADGKRAAGGDGNTASGSRPLPSDAPKHNGKTWAQLSPAEKHNLYVDDRETYDAMKQDHEQRSKG